MNATAILTNKHVVAAMIITPILAILGYFAVDRMVSEVPQRAEPGARYPLAASSKCRYASGSCQLRNGNFILTLRAESHSTKGIQLHLDSVFPLQAAKLSIAPDDDTDYPPLAMEAASEDGRRWRIATSVPVAAAPRLRLVAVADDSVYYGQTGLAFSVYETSYQRDFRGDQQ